MEWIRGPGDRGQGTGDMDIAYIANITLLHVQNSRDVFLSGEKKAPAACLARHKKVIIFKIVVSPEKQTPAACLARHTNVII